MLRIRFSKEGFELVAKTPLQMLTVLKQLPPILRELETDVNALVQCPNCGGYDLELFNVEELQCMRCGETISIVEDGGVK